VPEEDWTADQRKAYRIHHDFRSPAEVTARYPSHLHIDMVPRLQGGGNGRRLMNTLTAALREQGSPGVHLGVYAVNTRAVGFYRHVGFTELSSGNGAITFGMDLR
jgi:ribosomal protein S18 acetylase RimI-like enzyme